MKNHKNFFCQKDIDNSENKLPRISIKNNGIDSNNKNIHEKNKTYNQKIKDKKIVLNPIFISNRNNRYSNYSKTLVNYKKDGFDVILTYQNNYSFN